MEKKMRNKNKRKLEIPRLNYIKMYLTIWHSPLDVSSFKPSKPLSRSPKVAFGF